jgi:diacylglycerol O-acyltransferase 1
MSENHRTSLLVSIHTKENISLLSSEADSPNYRGFLNLGAIILLVANFRLMVENVLKYGFLLSNPYEVVNNYLSITGLVTYLLNAIPISLVYITEVKLVNSVSSSMSKWIQFIIQVYVLTMPLVSVSYYRVHFIPASVLLMFTIIIAMKLYSFFDVMQDAREAYKTKEYLTYPKEIKEIVEKYPNIVTLKHYCYFMVAPTMCFQFFYPRSPRIRKTWLLKRIIEYLLSLSLMLILIQQYITPLVHNTIPILQGEKINYISLLERHLKLSIPNLYLWLSLFYSGFQCYCNILSEITCFADRKFYLDWWNSRTLGEYWRKWNLPVHNWLLRHVHFPLTNKGVNKQFSIFVTFFLSALFHEYVISGACGLMGCWAFLAMMMQIPMVILMDLFKPQLEKSQIGNVVFWISFCIIGQPIAVLIYSYQALESLKSL